MCVDLISPSGARWCWPRLQRRLRSAAVAVWVLAGRSGANWICRMAWNGSLWKRSGTRHLLKPCYFAPAGPGVLTPSSVACSVPPTWPGPFRSRAPALPRRWGPTHRSSLRIPAGKGCGEPKSRRPLFFATTSSTNKFDPARSVLLFKNC